MLKRSSMILPCARSHFEHTYAILPDGKPFVLTAFDGGKADLARLGVAISDLL